MRILKNPLFLTVLAAVLLVAAILVLGWLLEWNWVVRLLGVVIVLFVCTIALAISFVRASKGAAAIEQSIKMQAQMQAKSARPDRQREVEDLQRQLERAIQMLKQSKLGQGRRSRSALYALPWYLFIGPPGSGKTTAIANSGLNFPVGTDRIRGVGGTRNCDWFFSDRAILLDTAGRYMTEADDEAEWLAFLETLKKHRPERPVNGVIVGIALSDIAESSLEEVEWHADMIRNRVEELIRQLGLRFPIYLVFTKCDLLQGFVEFFGELGRREREQVWGCTLSREQREGDAAAVFDEEFDLLYNALLNRRVARLSHAMKREERQMVYAFPMQFASMKEKLGLFVHRLFQPNPYQETPLFRGFYFTSGTQEGVPIDRVIRSIAEQFDMPPAPLELRGAEIDVKSYFIRELFTDVIIPDEHLASRTFGAVRQRRFLQARAAVVAVLLLALFVFGASQALVRSQLTLNRTRDAAAAAALVRWDPSAGGRPDLAGLKGLRQEMRRLERGSVLTLGLQRSAVVLPSAHGFYLAQARAFLDRYPLETIRRNLGATSAAALDDAATAGLFDDLKAYLLLTMEAVRLSGGEQAADYRSFLERHVGELSASAVQGSASATSGIGGSEEIPSLTAAFVTALSQGRLPPLDGDESLIERARRRLDQPATVSGIYGQLRSKGQDRLDKLTLNDLDMPARYRPLFAGRAEISRLYTRQGWEDFAHEEIRRLSRDPSGEEWVLGRPTEQVPTELRDANLVADRLQETYFADYATAWEDFLKEARLKQPRDLVETASMLEELGRTDSPLLYVLAYVSDQTRFEREGELAEATEAVRSRVRPSDMHPVDRRFVWLHEMNPGQAVAGGADAAPELHEALGALTNIADALSGIGGDEDALALAAEILGQNGGSFESELRTIQRATRGFPDRAVARNFFEMPVAAAWGAVVASAQRALSVRWREQVVQPFQQTLAGRYPFAESDDDALVLDVDRFFNPQSGVLARFTDEQLRAFLSADERQAAAWNGRGLEMSAVQQALAQAARIREGLFNSGGVMRLAFEMRPELPERSENAPPVAQVHIDLHGQRDTYTMGSPMWRSFVWPEGTPRAMLSVSTQQGQLPAKTFSGDWAMFRLLQNANVQQRTSSLYEVRWPFEQVGQYTVTVLYELKAQRGINPFQNPAAFFRFTPPGSIN